MYAFIYVFDYNAKEALQKKKYTLLKEDKANNTWVFENRNPDDYTFELEYPFVLSSVMSF